MNDEIKEILEHIQYVIDEDDYWEVTKETLKPLLDYINDLYLDNTMLKLEKDIYKQGYEELKGLLSSLQNGSKDE